MAHFAKLGFNNKVLKVIRVENSVLTDDGALSNEEEQRGKQFLESLHGWPAEYFVRCSYNTHEGKYWDRDENGTVSEASDQSKALRKNFPGIGDFYNEDKDYFHKPQPHTSWTLSDTTGQWQAPTAFPSVLLYSSGGNQLGYIIKWDEDNTRWLAAEEATPNTFEKVWNASTNAWDNI
jgi:hypothetical protein